MCNALSYIKQNDDDDDDGTERQSVRMSKN